MRAFDVVAFAANQTLPDCFAIALALYIALMSEHKVFAAVARLDDDAAMRWLLRSIKNAKEVRAVLGMVRTSILCPLYDEKMRVGRYIVLDIRGHLVGCHTVTDISPQ